jgi:hypothetical protein
MDIVQQIFFVFKIIVQRTFRDTAPGRHFIHGNGFFFLDHCHNGFDHLLLEQAVHHLFSFGGRIHLTFPWVAPASLPWGKIKTFFDHIVQKNDRIVKK